MQTKKTPSSKVSIIQPVTPKVKRGPKHRNLPVGIIKKWSSEGLGSKAISSRLKKERDIKVHFSTISRILNGQRVLV